MYVSYKKLTSKYLIVRVPYAKLSQWVLLNSKSENIFDKL